MTVYIEKPAHNLREELAQLRAQVQAQRQQPFWFTGNGTATAFALPRGWKPLHVYSAGALQKEGAGNQYAIGFDGFVYSVTFAVAPANLTAIAIVGVPA